MVSCQLERIICELRNELGNPICKSDKHHTLMETEKTKHLSKIISPLSSTQTEWTINHLQNHTKEYSRLRLIEPPRDQVILTRLSGEIN